MSKWWSVGELKPLSLAAQALPGSGIREVIELASTLQGVIHLEVGEPSFTTPAHIIDAAFASAAGGGTGYTSTFGSMALRRAIAASYAERWQARVSADHVLVTHGAVNAIAACAFAILDRGDEVLIPDPGWPNYVSLVSLIGAVPVRYPLAQKDNYRPDVETLARLITPRTKLLLLCNPGNPTGAVWDEDTVRRMIGLASAHDLHVLTDEIYESLVFDGEHVPASRFDRDGRVVTVSGLSKTFAMTGWRLGWAIGRPELIKLAGKIQEPLVTCASSISQAAALAALAGPQDDVAVMRDRYRTRRDIAASILGPAGLLPSRPQGAFYAMVDLSSTGLSSQTLARMLLEQERVACVPGSAFGSAAEGLLRISLAASDDDVAEGCRRFVRFSASHSPKEATP